METDIVRNDLHNVKMGDKVDGGLCDQCGIGRIIVVVGVAYYCSNIKFENGCPAADSPCDNCLMSG